jgi:hypothetical protein
VKPEATSTAVRCQTDPLLPVGRPMNKQSA